MPEPVERDGATAVKDPDIERPVNDVEAGSPGFTTFAGMDSPPLYEGVLSFAVAIAPVPLTLFFVFRRHLPRLEGAFYLVLWGLLIVVVEHVGFGRSEFGGSTLDTHEGFHFEMLAAYGLASFALAGLVIAPLIRRGDRFGWYGLAIMLSIGFTAEVLAARVTTPHGVPDRWWSWGLMLWAYPITWASALALSMRPTFRPGAALPDNSQEGTTRL